MKLSAVSLLPLGLATPLHPRQQAWTTLSPIPTGPIHEHSTVLLSPTQLATIGGVLQAGGVINSVYIYNIPNNTWTRASPLPITINHANGAVVDSKIYVLGGMTGPSWSGTPNSYVYDPTTDKWTSISPMPASEARGSAVMGVHNKTIWLASGKTGSGGRSVTTVSAFDTASGKWITVPDKAKNIPEGRDHGGGGIVGTKFYQIAGSDGAIANRKDTVFVLDLEALEKGWVTAKGKMPTPRRGFASAVVGEEIWTFGGEGNPDTQSGVFGEVEVYDTGKDSWRKVSGMKVPRHGSSAVAVGGRIYIPGGGTAMGTPATDLFDVYSV
ncbi:hypothetical protein OQA88_7051 [Cercophora sp. LCS_1]